jgi:allantoin racemase
MRIVWHVALTRDSAGRLDDPAPLWAAVESYAAKVTRADTEVELGFLGRTAEAMLYPAVMLLNGALMVEDVRARAAAGVDAVLIAATGEPGLQEARSAVDIPVAGSVEAGLAMSQLLGARVGVVTINPEYTDIILRNIERHGLAGRLAGRTAVRSFALSWDAVAAALAGRPDALVTPFREAVDSLVRDGADVVVGGGQIFGALLDHIGCEPGPVPFVDGAAAGLKWLEALVDLRATTGLRTTNAATSPFRRVPDGELDRAFAALYKR